MGALLDEFIYFSEGTDEGKNLGCSVFLETVANDLISFIDETSTTKFYFYSAHDTTVAAILAGLRAPVHYLQPPFASTLLFELWDQGTSKPDYRVTIIYDGVPIAIPGCNVN
jgi:hypothetical protein